MCSDCDEMHYDSIFQLQFDRRFPLIWSFEKNLTFFDFQNFGYRSITTFPVWTSACLSGLQAAWSQPLQPSRTAPHSLSENKAKLQIRLFMKTFRWGPSQGNVFMKRRIRNLALFSKRGCGTVREGCSGCDQAALQTGEASAGPNWECCNRAISENLKTEKC